MTDWRDRATLTVEQAASVLGIGRSAGYLGASRGEIPTIRVGRRLLVPVGQLRALLGENEGAAAVARDDAIKLGTGAAQHADYTYPN